MANCKLEFNLTDYTSYRELKATINGEDCAITKDSPEFMGL